MSARLLSDPWRVVQVYALVLALVLAVVGVLVSADAWSADGRPVQHVECEGCGVWTP